MRNLDFLGGEVALTDAVAGEPVIVRANYYPAWRATVNGHDVPLYDSGGQLAFRAPATGTVVVKLRYPKYRWLNLSAAMVFLLGAVALARRPRGSTPR